MKTFKLLLPLLLAAAALPVQLLAQQMNYQGRLTDASGNPLTDGQYVLTFEIWDSPTSGVKIWGPFTNDGTSGNGHGPKADLVNGRFNVILGANDVTGRPLTNAFGATRYLQISVATDAPLLPRQQILAAPEALHAYQADHATIADGINGNLDITGAFKVGGASTFNGPLTAAGGITGPVAVTGNLQVDGSIFNTTLINFAPGLAQMLFLGPQYGMGIQTGTEYFRSSSGFAWYRGGVHANAANNSGGGQTLMVYDGNGLTVYGQAPFTAAFQNLAKGANVSYAGWGATGDWYLRSSANNGTVVIQDQGGDTKIGGKVAIGNGGADYPLHVYSTVNHNFNQGVGDLQNYSGGVYQHLSFASDYSIVAAGAMWAPSFQATSDRRIKSIDRISDTAKDLETVQKLKVTDYHYIDTESNGSRSQKGFIAQEVQKVIPEAVMSGPGYIPNIFADAIKVAYDPAQQRLTVHIAKSHALQKGDKVRLLSEKNGSLELSVESISSDSEFVVTNCEKEPGRVFVYGKHVDDLLNLNYDRIFSTGIGAIQELTKRVKDLEERQQRVAELERKAERVENLEQEVSKLTKLVTGLLQMQQVSARDALAAE
jgi:hypothetical protein